MKKEKKIKNWEKEFDKSFRAKKIHSIGYGMWQKRNPLTIKEVKSFIHQLLQRARQEEGKKWAERLAKAEARNFQTGRKEAIDKVVKMLEDYDTENPEDNIDEQWAKYEAKKYFLEKIKSLNQ